MFTSIMLTIALAAVEPVVPVQQDPQLMSYRKLINKKPCNSKAIENLLLQILEEHKANESIIEHVFLQKGQCTDLDTILTAAIASDVDPVLLSKFFAPTSGSIVLGTIRRLAPPPASMIGGGSGSGAKDSASNN